MSRRKGKGRGSGGEEDRQGREAQKGKEERNMRGETDRKKESDCTSAEQTQKGGKSGERAEQTASYRMRRANRRGRARIIKTARLKDKIWLSRIERKNYM